jgi:DNA repair protein RadA
LVETIRGLEDLPGIGPVTAQKLRLAGYNTLESLALAPSRELIDTVGLSEEKAISLSLKAREMLQIKFQTAVKTLMKYLVEALKVELYSN